MGNPISFELSDAELQLLRDLGWGRGRTDLMCQTIVRDYLKRMQAKAARIARKIQRADRAGSARRAGL